LDEIDLNLTNSLALLSQSANLQEQLEKEENVNKQ
jgi:hypothetical protein